MTQRIKILSLILLGVVAGGLVYLRVLAQRMTVQPPPPHAEYIARAKLNESALQTNGPQQTATLYFPVLEQGTLVEEKRPIAWASSNIDRIRQVILALVEGSGQGLGRSLPLTTEVRGVFLTPDGTAYLDLSGQTVADVSPGILSECLAADSIVRSLTLNVPAVKRVKILVQGQAVDTLDGHADLSETLVPDLTATGTNP